MGLQCPLPTGQQNFSFTAAKDLEPQKRPSQAPPGGSSAHSEGRRACGPQSGTVAPGAPPSARPPRALVSAGVGTPWVRQGSPRPGASPGRGVPGPAGPAAGAAQVSPRPGLTRRAREPGGIHSDSQEAPWRARSLGASGWMGATTAGGSEGGRRPYQVAQRAGASSAPKSFTTHRALSWTQSP